MTDANKLNSYFSVSGDRKEDEKVLEPIFYLLKTPGKQIRRNLINAFDYWLRIPDDKLQSIIEIVNIIHNSSIMIDDIQDNSTLRRGIPVAHSVYGIPWSLSAAYYLTTIAFEKLLEFQHSAATKVYTEQLLNLHRGQGMDIFWRDNFICPTEADYENMILRKTGGLFNLGINLMELFSTYKEDLSLLKTVLGLYFQIRDDYCNLCLDEYTETKSYCDDLTEGKFSFPIIHAITNNPKDKQILNILKQRTKDIEVKRYCIKLLETFGSLEYTKNKLKELDSTARNEIERLGGNPLLVQILDDLKNWDTKNTPKDY